MSHCRFQDCTEKIYADSFCDRHYLDVASSATVDDDLSGLALSSDGRQSGKPLPHPDLLISTVGRLFGTIINGYQKVLKIKVEEENFVFEKRAAYYMKTGQSAKAIPLFEFLLKSKPREPSILYHLGSAYCDQGQYSKAIVFFQQVLELDSSHTRAHFQLGNSYYKEKMFDEAIQTFAKLLAAHPHHVGAHYKMAMSYMAKEMNDEAEIWLKKALAISPNIARLHQSLGLCLEKKGDAKEALKCFKKALEFAPPKRDFPNTVGSRVATFLRDHVLPQKEG